MKLLPVESGLDRKWMAGEVALLRVVYRPCFTLVCKNSSEGRFVLCLDDSGEVNYHSIQDLVSVEGYRAHINYMRDDLTGRQYRDAMEAPLCFETPEWWESAVNRVMNPEGSNAITRANPAK